MTHKSGFVNIIGNPNVGKSTLMNVLLNEKLSIVTSKAQTTRHRILGILNDDDYQVVFSDTPGILKPHYKMHEAMMGFVQSAINDADVILYVTDVKETIDKNSEYIQKVNNSNVPVILVINKIDLCKSDEIVQLNAQWKELLPRAEIIPISAQDKFNIHSVLTRILEALPEGPAFYDKDALTDKTERFFVSEIIREKIFRNYKKEVPYSVEVGIEEFIEEPNIIRIKAVIIVSRPTQKGIIIGKGGEALKKVATRARLDIETFFGKKVFLEVFVKVEKDWRDSDRLLREFGYNN
ncbi:MAG: GTPase Era [Bacteroidota bacterium]|nr:GTPase Era [Bacteroidota bacterium]